MHANISCYGFANLGNNNVAGRLCVLKVLVLSVMQALVDHMLRLRELQVSYSRQDPIGIRP